MTDEEFKDRLVRMMEDKGLDAEACARLVGAPRPTVERWTKGDSVPHRAMREAIISMIDK